MIRDKSGVMSLTLVDLLPDDFPPDGKPGVTAVSSPVRVGRRDSVSIEGVACWLVLDHEGRYFDVKGRALTRYRAHAMSVNETEGDVEVRHGGKSVGRTFISMDQAIQYAQDMSDLAQLHDE